MSTCPSRAPALKNRALRMVAAHWSDYPLGTSRSGVGGRDLATRFGFKAAHQIEQPLGDTEHRRTFTRLTVLCGGMTHFGVDPDAPKICFGWLDAVTIARWA